MIPKIILNHHAFFMSPEGEMFPVTKHIEAIVAAPEKFGLTRDYIEAQFLKYGERIGSEGKARRELIKEVVGKGWIRMRYYPRNDRWSINAAELNDSTKAFLQDWGRMILKYKKSGYCGILLTTISGKRIETTLQDISSGSLGGSEEDLSIKLKESAC